MNPKDHTFSPAIAVLAANPSHSDIRASGPVLSQVAVIGGVGKPPELSHGPRLRVAPCSKHLPHLLKPLLLSLSSTRPTQLNSNHTQNVSFDSATTPAAAPPYNCAKTPCPALLHVRLPSDVITARRTPTCVNDTALRRIPASVHGRQGRSCGRCAV
jgi:hypothetical protein